MQINRYEATHTEKAHNSIDWVSPGKESSIKDVRTKVLKIDDLQMKTLPLDQKMFAVSQPPPPCPNVRAETSYCNFSKKFNYFATKTLTFTPEDPRSSTLVRKMSEMDKPPPLCRQRTSFMDN